MMCEIPKVLMTVTSRMNGYIVVKAHKTSPEEKLISQKVALVGVEMFTGVELECYDTCLDEV